MKFKIKGNYVPANVFDILDQDRFEPYDQEAKDLIEMLSFDERARQDTEKFMKQFDSLVERIKS